MGHIDKKRNWLQGLDRFLAHFDQAPWRAHTAARSLPQKKHNSPPYRQALYTPDERKRRDQTSWTLVQAILAPLQFIVFLISLSLVMYYLITGNGYEWATLSIIIKTFILYTIMITGALWERAVFGHYLFARAFFWEDVVSLLVIALHSAYLGALWMGSLTPVGLMSLALAAYAVYLINAVQFLLKFRHARKDRKDKIENPIKDPIQTTLSQNPKNMPETSSSQSLYPRPAE